MLALAVAATGACGGGSSPPPATIAAQAKDQLAVDAAVLQITDLPGQWDTNRAASTASDSLATSDDVLAVADVCFPTADGITSTTAREYVSGRSLGHVLVRGVVEAHTDAASVTGKLSAFTVPAAAACLKDGMTKLLADGGATIADPSVAPTTVEGAGDESGGFIVSMPVSTPGGDFTIGADIVFARTGRFRATCTVIYPQEQPDHQLCADGLEAMLRRVELNG